MPYIKEIDRYALNRALPINILNDLSAGDLNYFITKLLLKQKPRNYEDYNRLIGVLECVKLELYRRAIVSYEDKKIKENGDVYETV